MSVTSDLKNTGRSDAGDQDLLRRSYRVVWTIYDLPGNDLLPLSCSLWTKDECVTLSFVKTDFGRFWTEFRKTAGDIMSTCKSWRGKKKWGGMYWSIMNKSQVHKYQTQLSVKV